MQKSWFRVVFGQENRVQRPLQIGGEDFYGIDGYDLEVGKILKTWNAAASLRSTSVECDGEADDILCERLGVPTFSQRLRTELEQECVAISDIQYLPIKVFQSTGEEVKGFAIANVITRIPALCRERSVMLEQDADEIDPLTSQPKVTSMWRPALLKEPLEGHDMIRLLEFFPPVFVSERFANVFHKGRFTGATLVPVPVI